MSGKKIKIGYDGSKGWLIFWIIVFFPIALVLLLTGGRFEDDGKIYRVQYEGSRNWLCFWTLACFPIAFALLLLNGIELHLGTELSPGPHRLEA